MLAHIEVLLTAGLFPQNESKDLKKNIFFFYYLRPRALYLNLSFLVLEEPHKASPPPGDVKRS